MKHGETVILYLINQHKKLKNEGVKVSVTLDEWTSIGNRRFINVNVHSPILMNNFINLGLDRVCQPQLPYTREKTVIIRNILNFKNILHCLTSGYLMFHQEFFLQRDGIAMGLPVSPVIADIYMEDFKDCS